MPHERRATLYFDVISPFAYLLHATLKKRPLPIALDLKPVLFAAMLDAFGQKGPAEIASKRTATYEYCTWLGQTNGIPFLMPAAHPFNPIRYLRLILEHKCQPEVVSAVFDILFTTGLDPEAAATWNMLLEQLPPADEKESSCTSLAALAPTDVKKLLRENTDEAIAMGVFGVPTIALDGKLFWGLDALPMLLAYLKGDASFESNAMQQARNVRIGATRKM